MPTYEYECDKCKKVVEVMQSMTAERLKTHKECEETDCDGKVVRLIGAGGGVIFKGSGWTPQFGGKAGSARKKIDQALKAAGIEDYSPGWTTSDDKPDPVKKPPKKKKYVGQLNA